MSINNIAEYLNNVFILKQEGHGGPGLLNNQKFGIV